MTSSSSAPGAPADIEVVHVHGEAVEVAAGGTVLFRYVYRADPAAFEGYRPYAHPVRTLGGDLVTAYRPHDHRWHKGLQFAVSHLSGQNLWGGNSYVHGEGYLPLEDLVGHMLHEGFDRFAVHADRVELTERLRWTTAAGDALAAEVRDITVGGVRPESGTYTIEWSSAVTNLRGEPLRFGSPTTEGRPMAGYTGLAWRGPRSFTGGDILGPGEQGGPGMMGESGPWLAFVGRHDDVDAESTLLFEHHPDNGADNEARGVGAPKWFVRNDPFPIANPSLAFDTEIELEPGAELRRSYRVTVRDGAWDRAAIESYRTAHPWPRR